MTVLSMWQSRGMETAQNKERINPLSKTIVWALEMLDMHAVQFSWDFRGPSKISWTDLEFKGFKDFFNDVTTLEEHIYKYMKPLDTI